MWWLSGCERVQFLACGSPTVRGTWWTASLETRCLGHRLTALEALGCVMHALPQGNLYLSISIVLCVYMEYAVSFSCFLAHCSIHYRIYTSTSQGFVFSATAVLKSLFALPTCTIHALRRVAEAGAFHLAAGTRFARPPRARAHYTVRTIFAHTQYSQCSAQTAVFVNPRVLPASKLVISPHDAKDSRARGTHYIA